MTQIWGVQEEEIEDKCESCENFFHPGIENFSIFSVVNRFIDLLYNCKYFTLII